MVFWFWVGFAILAVPPIAVGLGMAALYLFLRWKYVPLLVRIFQERPLFVIPRGAPTDDAEPVTFPAADGLTLVQAQYTSGGASYLQVLSAEQSYQTASIALVKARAQRYADTAALFQALGGGWWNRNDLRLKGT